jgi:predicted pyridoxine 5'-phosphate oxidase superfamily flavin-nucleotide-binding protein
MQGFTGVQGTLADVELPKGKEVTEMPLQGGTGPAGPGRMRRRAVGSFVDYPVPAGSEMILTRPVCWRKLRFGEKTGREVRSMVIPEAARAVLDRQMLMAFATCSKQGIPNVVYMLQYWWLNENELVIGDVFMNATRRNVEENGHVSFCVWDEQADRSYKFKGAARYETSGTAYELANQNLHKKKPDKNFKGVIAVKITEVYDASRGPNAGRLIATE